MWPLCEIYSSGREIARKKGKNSQVYNDGLKLDIFSEIIAEYLAGRSLFRIFWMEIFYFLGITAVTSNLSCMLFRQEGRKNRTWKPNQCNL